MAVLFAVFLNEKMMKAKTETNKQTKSDISTSERQPSANGCQHLTHAQSYFFVNRCLWIAVLVLARPSQHNQGAEQRQQTKQNQQKKKKKHTKNWCSSGLFFLLLRLL